MSPEAADPRQHAWILGDESTAPEVPLGFPLSTLRWGGALALGVAAGWPSVLSHLPVGCLVYETTGMPCPMCGMTRSVSALAHGDVVGSLTFNPAGVVVVLVVLVALLSWRVDSVRIPPRAAVACLAALWAWNVLLNPTF